jgi:2-polyprenyl-3-methyl-5-hydroxy-6-metoxy-1,4-benzoquinol methylase
MSRIHYQKCPLCGSEKIGKKLAARDYTVSQETFDIWECGTCTGRFTQDVPDVAEIGRYYQSAEYISHSETREGLINRMYHSVRKITMRSKQNWVKTAAGVKTGALLDIGSGTGAFLAHMKQLGWQVTGLEPDATARENALKHHKVESSSIEDLFKLEPGRFDCITMWHVLEHVHDLHNYLEQIRTLLKPGGALLVAVPNYKSTDARIYGSEWAAYDVPRHLYHFSPVAMDMLMQQHRLDIVTKHPMVFDAFYVSLLSQKYKTGKSGLLAGGFKGLRSYWKAWRHVDKCSSIVYECKVAK